MGNYLLNHDGACDYGEVIGHAEIGAPEVSGKGDLIRKHQGGRGVLSSNFETIYTTACQNGFDVMKSNSGKPIGRKRNSDDPQSRLEKSNV